MRIIPFPHDRRRPSQITGLHFSADGRHLVAMIRAESWIMYPCRWDLRQQARVEEGVGIGCEEDAGVAPEPAFSPDERFLAYVYIERGPELSLRLVDRAARPTSPRRERRLTAWPGCRSCPSYLALRFTPDGRTLVAAAVNTGEEEDRTDEGESGLYRWSVARVARGRGLKWDGHLLPDKGHVPIADPDFQSLEGLGKSVAFTPDGSQLAVGLWKNRVRLMHFPSGDEGHGPLLIERRRNPGAWPLAFSPDGETLAVADGDVTLYEMRQGLSRVVLPSGPPVRSGRSGVRRRPVVRDLAFDPSGRVLATANGDPVVRWWDATTGTALKSYDWGIGGVTAVAFSADGCLCAAAGAEGQVAVWDVID